MKFSTILLFAVVFSITDDQRALIDEINSNPSLTWKAGEYSDEILSHEKFVNSLIPPKVWNERTRNIDAPIGRVPPKADVAFDSRLVWGPLILPVRDQGQCGSCWAFAVAETVGDRVGIERGISAGPYSPQDLVSCDLTDLGCNGGEVANSWAWVKNIGITSDDCIPYSSSDGVARLCDLLCRNGSLIPRTRASQVYPVPFALMQEELFTNGPFEVAFDVYADFELYISGIYQKSNSILNIYMGGHAVLVVGWGVENLVPYWIVQNSWGPAWGEIGFFRIIRGVNECDIESNGYAGTGFV